MYYRLYNVDNTRKSKIKGFWLDNNKIYKDNIFIKRFSNKKDLKKAINSLFNNGELCVFYKSDNRGIIQAKSGDITLLKNRLLLKRIKLSINEIKKLLSIYNGLTIYNCKRSKGLYFIEIFYT